MTKSQLQTTQFALVLRRKSKRKHSSPAFRMTRFRSRLNNLSFVNHNKRFFSKKQLSNDDYFQNTKKGMPRLRLACLNL